MNNEKFVIDYDKQSKLKDSLEIAIAYCKENAPKTDSWSRQRLESHQANFEDLLSSIGNGFVVGHFE